MPSMLIYRTLTSDKGNVSCCVYHTSIQCWKLAHVAWDTSSRWSFIAFPTQVMLQVVPVSILRMQPLFEMRWTRWHQERLVFIGVPCQMQLLHVGHLEKILCLCLCLWGDCTLLRSVSVDKGHLQFFTSSHQKNILKYPFLNQICFFHISVLLKILHGTMFCR